MNNICEATTIKPPLFPFFPLSLANTLYTACVFYASSKCIIALYIYIVYETSFFVECANRFWVSSGSDHWPRILSLFHTQKSGVLINKFVIMTLEEIKLIINACKRQAEKETIL